MATIMNVDSGGTGLSIGTAKAESNKLLSSLPVYIRTNNANKLLLQNAKDGEGYNVIWLSDNSEANGWSLRHDISDNTFRFLNRKGGSSTETVRFRENLTQFLTSVQITSGQLLVPNNETSWTNGISNLAYSAIKKQNGVITSSAYFPLFSVKTGNGHHVSLGGIGDQFGLFGRKSSETSNTYNYAWTLDVQNGTMRGTGQIINSGDIITLHQNGFRIVHGNHGVIFRNDGSYFHLLMTKSGDQYGTWNALYPFKVDLSTGLCYINGKPGNVSLGTSATPSGGKGNIYIQY